MSALQLAVEATGAVAGMTDKGLQQLGAGLAIGLAAGGGATGIGILWSKGLEGIGRQPEARGTLQGLMFVGFALAEAQVLYGLIVALLLLLGIF